MKMDLATLILAGADVWLLEDERVGVPADANWVTRTLEEFAVYMQEQDALENTPAGLDQPYLSEGKGSGEGSGRGRIMFATPNTVAGDGAGDGPGRGSDSSGPRVVGDGGGHGPGHGRICQRHRRDGTEVEYCDAAREKRDEYGWRWSSWS